MRTYILKTRQPLTRSAVVTLTATAMAAGVLFAGPAIAQTATPPAGPLVNNCTVVGGAFDCHLYAASGTANIGPVSVPVRTYTATNVAPTKAVGPTLVVDGSAPLKITLHNGLSVATSLVIPAANGFQPITAAAAATTATPALTLTPGTYLYEAKDPRQVATGMVGALIVKASATSAYAGKTAFDDEAALVLTEADPTFMAAPETTSLRSWKPKYQMINGMAHPATSPLATGNGRKVLLRYVNGGLNTHTMGVLGARQTIIGIDARAAKHDETDIAVSVLPGQAIDAVITMPNRSVVPVYETSATSGMMMSLRSGGTVTTPTGATVSAMTVSPTTVGGGEVSTLTATIVGTPVAGYTYSIDGGTPVTVTLPSPVPSTSVSVALPSTLAGGNHVVSLAGISGGTAGAAVTRTLTVDNQGPLVTAFTATNGASGIALSFTASDLIKGNANVTSAEWSLIPSGSPAPAAGSGTALSVPAPAVSVNLAETVTIPTSITADGSYQVVVRARDARSNWSDPAVATVNLDRTGPTTTNTSTDPVFTNGTQASPVAPGGQIVLKATVTDTLSNINAAESFAGATAPTTGFGTGVSGLPLAGTFDALTEDIGIKVPIGSLPAAPFQGLVTYQIHGKDAAGNWGPFVPVQLTVDRTAPTATATAPGIVLGAATNTITVTAADPVSGGVSSGVRRFEWFEATDPGVGLAAQVVPSGPSPFTFTVPTATAPVGSRSIRVRVLDNAGNWSAIATATYTVTAPNEIFRDTFTGSLATGWTNSGSTANAAGQLSTAALGQLVTNTTPLAEATYLSQFDFTPGTLRGTNATATIDVFSGFSNNAPANGNRIFRVQFRRNPNTAAGVGQVRLGVRGTGTNETFSAWVNLPSATTSVRVDWTAATAASVTLKLGGATAGTVSTNTSAWRVEAVQLGLLAGGLTGGTGPALFDNFQSARTTLPLAP